MSHPNPRQLAFQTLRAIAAGAYADIALDRTIQRQTPSPSTDPAPEAHDAVKLSATDRRLLSELVYGCVRRQRSLDTLIDRWAKKPAAQQSPDLRLILHLGFYQLCYLDHIPRAAAVHTTVELAKANGLGGLSGLVNGVLRQYLRHNPEGTEVLADAGLAVRQSYPDWIIDLWQQQLPSEEVEAIARWFNQPPHLDLRINPLRSSLDQVEAALQAAGLQPQRLSHLPLALRLQGAVGSVQALPGFAKGWWMVQDASAQMVSLLLDPQPGEMVIDACAAPGGKTLHMAELMGNEGQIIACDRTPSRLRKLQTNAQRLGITNLEIRSLDSTQAPDLQGLGDRVLVDAPCSGLGTLHRHADARWRQSPAQIEALTQLQRQLLHHTATWVKPGGSLVYATCTLHPGENDQQITHFLDQHPDWQITPPPPTLRPFATGPGWIQVWPHYSDMDGFFMVRLQRS